MTMSFRRRKMTIPNVSKKRSKTSVQSPSSSLPIRNLDWDKMRGGYYTSDAVAGWLCSWAIRKKSDTVLEPSCGDGAILGAAAARLLKLDAAPSVVLKQLTGVELHDSEAEGARVRIRGLLGRKSDSTVISSDFFNWWKAPSRPCFDVVVGNPPFIRYQAFPAAFRELAMEIMKEAGLKPNKLTNMWVPFVVAATLALKEGGRLALVLPAELLQVTYAAQLRAFLINRFRRIDIVTCNELLFEDAEQEVVLLLADSANPASSSGGECRVAMTETTKAVDITSTPPIALLGRSPPKKVQHDSEKWLKYFLTNKEIALMRELRDSGNAVPMSEYAEVDVGVVTGKNEFFVLNLQQVEEYGLQRLVSPVVSRSAQLKGAVVNAKDWEESAASGGRMYLLNIGAGQAARLPSKVREYIAMGEAREYHKGFKCSIRSPWFSVPAVWSPDGFLFRQIYDFPRIVKNTADAASTDTIHRLTVKKGSVDQVIGASYSWLTSASAEIEGRSYGGGVLELEPTEAERMLMPSSIENVMSLQEIDSQVRRGRIDSVLEENARNLLQNGMGLSISDCKVLQGIWVKMRDRRLSRHKFKKVLKNDV